MSDLADKIREQLKFNEAEVDTLLGDERFGMSTITGKEDIAWLTEQLNKLAEVKCREVVLGLVEADVPEGAISLTVRGYEQVACVMEALRKAGYVSARGAAAERQMKRVSPQPAAEGDGDAT